ncbi:MAG: alpha/beta hydrolase [Solirubrobacteraceae bacterium]
MTHVLPVAIATLVTMVTLTPLRHPMLAASTSFWLTYMVSEAPILAFCWLFVSSIDALTHVSLSSRSGLMVLGLLIMTTGCLALVVWRQLMAGAAVARAVNDALSLGGHPETVGRCLPRRTRPASLVRLILGPLPVRPRAVERVANIIYGPARRHNRLDLYRHRSRPGGAPVLIHFHGGHFRMGGKSREARALFHRFAGQGWVCVSADYRLRRAGRFPASLIDAKRVIAWVRQHAAEYGADPSLVVVAGSSAGAHLASMAALTPNNPTFQPGFESDDTSVSGAVCLYGYYGGRGFEGALPSSPRAYIHRDAPPFFVAHGDNDTLVPVASAASFAHALRSASLSPVVYAPLPGAQHTFDLLRSIRLERVLDGIETFTTSIRAHHDPAIGRPVSRASLDRIGPPAVLESASS